MSFLSAFKLSFNQTRLEGCGVTPPPNWFHGGRCAQPGAVPTDREAHSGEVLGSTTHSPDQGLACLPAGGTLLLLRGLLLLANRGQAREATKRHTLRGLGGGGREVPFLGYSGLVVQREAGVGGEHAKAHIFLCTKEDRLLLPDFVVPISFHAARSPHFPLIGLHFPAVPKSEKRKINERNGNRDSWQLWLLL